MEGFEKRADETTGRRLEDLPATAQTLTLQEPPVSTTGHWRAHPSSIQCHRICLVQAAKKRLHILEQIDEYLATPNNDKESWVGSDGFWYLCNSLYRAFGDETLKAKCDAMTARAGVQSKKITTVHKRQYEEDEYWLDADGTVVFVQALL